MAPASGEPHSFWDAVRSWADSAGLLLPPDPEKAADTGPVADVPRPKVPQAVCDSCPICQAAATLDQVNPRVVADLTEVARQRDHGPDFRAQLCRRPARAGQPRGRAR